MFDGRRAQVFVESMIVEMDANKAAELGFQWQGLLGNSGDRFGLAAGTNFGTGTAGTSWPSMSSAKPAMVCAGASGNSSVASSSRGFGLRTVISRRVCICRPVASA